MRGDHEVIGSAEGACFARAAAARERDPKVANPDFLAKHFLGWRYATHLRVVPAALSRLIFELLIPGGYAAHAARTRHCDRMLHASLDSGAKQLVLLGAGYDTRAYRFRARLLGVPVFEVDLPGTQDRKKARLRKLYGELPSHVRYVAIDFARQSLADVLLPAGYDPSLPTHFNWDGVTYYIDEPAITRVLDFVRDRAGRGSAIVFDYFLRSFVEGDLSSYGARKLVHYAVTKQKEPFLFGLNEDEIRAFMAARGFEIESDYGPSELSGMYLTRSDGSRLGRPWGAMRMSYARAS
jgi:methyltransferase (TIGR00027 family)